MGTWPRRTTMSPSYRHGHAVTEPAVGGTGANPSRRHRGGAKILLTVPLSSSLLAWAMATGSYTCPRAHRTMHTACKNWCGDHSGLRSALKCVLTQVTATMHPRLHVEPKAVTEPDSDD